MSELKLELGDIIQIESPSNTELDDKIFLIYYIDTTLIRILDTVDLEFNDLNIVNNKLMDESITSISILRKEEEKGYARQHGLLPKTWIEIKFSGDIPAIIVAEITDLQEDMIELTSYPDNKVFYIDFGYKGIPLDIPIEQIQIRDKPIEDVSEEIKVSEKRDSIKDDIDGDNDDIKEDVDDIFDGDDELVLELPKKDVMVQVGDVLAEAEDIMFGDVEDITQEVNVSDDEKRFSLDEQTNDLLDEMLSTIPNLERTNKVLSRINRMINRFTQLREKYSSFDFNNVIDGLILKTSNHKPLVESLKKLNRNLYWLLPIVKNRKEIFDVMEENEDSNLLINVNEDVIPKSSSKMVGRINTIIENYKNNSQIESTNSYSSFIKILMNEMDNYELPSENESLYVGEVNSNINVVFDNVLKNLQEFYSSVYKKDVIKKNRFVISKYNLGLNMLKADEIRGSYMKSHAVELTKNDSISLKGFVALPYKFVEYSRINLPGTTIYDKTNLNEVKLSYWNTLRRSTSIVKNTITERVDYNKSKFIDTIKSFVMNDEILENTDLSSSDKEQNYVKFLEAFIPTTMELFNTYKDFINNGLSIEAVIRQLEPFMIYREDLTYKQYTVISEFIEANILQLKQRLIINTKDTNTLRGLKTQVSFANGILMQLLGASKYDIEGGYKLPENTPVMNSELYSKLMVTDYGVFYNTNIQYLTRDLNVNVDVNQVINANIDTLETKIDDKDNSECNTRELVKTYFSIDELNLDDNNPDVFYDKKYDTTNYDFVKEYSNERDNMNPEEFREFIVDKLVQNIGMVLKQLK